MCDLQIYSPEGLGGRFQPRTAALSWGVPKTTISPNHISQLYAKTNPPNYTPAGRKPALAGEPSGQAEGIPPTATEDGVWAQGVGGCDSQTHGACVACVFLWCFC